MEYKLVGIHNGIELFNPAPEDEYEGHQIKVNEDYACNLLADLIVKYEDVIQEQIGEN